MATIGIGIPFYNAEKYLDFAIRSVINQSFTDWVLYLVDDGSTDSSLAIAKKYETDNRIMVISDSENKGLVYRLNQITDLLDTKYIARMDADDIMHPNRLKIQLEYLETNLQVDVVGSWAYSIDVNNNIIGILENLRVPKCKKDVMQHKCFVHPSIMGKREWFVTYRYSSLCSRLEDMELWCRTIHVSCFRNIQKPLMFYRDLGIPYLSKYLLSMNGERNLIRMEFVGLRRCKLLLRNYLKCFIYIVFSLLGKQNVLIKKRSFRINKDTIAQGNMDLVSAIKK